MVLDIFISLFSAGGGGDLLEEDEQMVDQAIDGDLFEFLTISVVAAQDFHNDVCHSVVVNVGCLGFQHFL